MTMQTFENCNVSASMNDVDDGKESGAMVRCKKMMPTSSRQARERILATAQWRVYMAIAHRMVLHLPTHLYDISPYWPSDRKKAPC